MISHTGTVQSLIDSGYTLTAYCDNRFANCHHHQVLDLIKLRERIGPDGSTMHDDLVTLLKCTACGSKRV